MGTGVCPCSKQMRLNPLNHGGSLYSCLYEPSERVLCLTMLYSVGGKCDSDVKFSS